MPSYGNFDLTYSGKCNGIIQSYKYKSSKTGLQVVISEIDGPLVEGYLCIATEAHDNDGLPHTLEHLVFMGSDKYPYKGILDMYANRCLASGTNAWTDTDHTCYTMTTAGDQGFLNLLPIYLDHILNPILSKSAYITEVHHINGEGEDAGVVYCEMQAHENQAYPILLRSMFKLLYPDSGYSAETGGKLFNLRESTSHTKVRQYHKDFYRAENLAVIISGTIDRERLFTILNEFENTLPEMNGDFVRPWLSPVKPLERSHTLKLKYPSDNTDHGEIAIAWRVGSCQDQTKMIAIQILMDYLTDTAVSPLQKVFVECSDAFCAGVNYSLIENQECCVYVSFASVQSEHLDDVNDKLIALFEDISEGREPFDLKRLNDLLKKSQHTILSRFEDNPNETIASHFIGDFLYSMNNTQTDERMNQNKIMYHLLTQEVSYWLNLFKQYFYKQNYVLVVGEASIQLMKDMGVEEEDRVKAQRVKLGESGLSAKAEVLVAACADNEVLPPVELLKAIDVSDVSRIKFHSLDSATNQKVESFVSVNKELEQVVAKMPIHFQMDDIASNFVNVSSILLPRQALITTLLDCSKLSVEYNEYLSMFTELLLESPLLMNSVVVDHEDVIKHIAAVTVTNDCSQGVHGSRFNVGIFPEFITLEFKSTREDYETVVTLIADLLFNLIVTPARLRVIASKMLKAAQTSKENGGHVLKAMIKTMLYKNDSKIVQGLMIHQCKFLTQLLQDLNENSDKIVDLFKKMGKEVANKIVLHMCTDVAAMISHSSKQSGNRTMYDIWNERFPKLAVTPWEVPIERSLSSLKDVSKDTKCAAYIIGVGSVESAFFIQSTESIRDYSNVKGVAQLKVYLQYLTQLEGPLWRSVRGQGLAYHYNIYLQLETGLLTLVLRQATHVAKAYKVLKETIMNYLNDASLFNQVEFESCKSSLMYEMITNEKTIADASRQSMMCYLSKSSHTFNKFSASLFSRDVLKEIEKIELCDLKAIGEKYVKPLFDMSIANVALVCNPSKVDDVMADFKGTNIEFVKLQGVEDDFFNGM